jgi:uncharacterized membrane protein
MYIGLLFIVFPLVDASNNKNKLWVAVKFGGLFGLVVYGIFNATNYAIFKGYNPWIAFQDTLWGTFVYSFVVYVTLVFFPSNK